MKNILITVAAVGVSFYLAKIIVEKTIEVLPRQGATTLDTKGREIIFQMNKNGYLTDQYGGLWA